MPNANDVKAMRVVLEFVRFYIHKVVVEDVHNNLKVHLCNYSYKWSGMMLENNNHNLMISIMLVFCLIVWEGGYMFCLFV